MPDYSKYLAAAAVTCALAIPLASAHDGAGVDAGDRGGVRSYVTYTGTATALHSQKFLYGEKHVLTYRDGTLAERVVLYTCRNGSPFARKSVSYVHRLAPDFILDDTSTGMREGIRSDGARRIVFFRARRADPEKSGPVPSVSDLVADAGFDEFVRAHWQSLLMGRSSSIRFLVPSRLDDFGFRVQHQRSDRVDGVAVEVFHLKLAGLFGWLLPGIDVYYGAADQVLMRYVGLSDLRSAGGDNLAVDLAFHPADRQPGAAADFENAVRARLAPCL